MRTNLLVVLLPLFLLAAWPATLQAQNSLILSKDGGGSLVNKSLTLTLRTNPTCDQTAQILPDGSRLVAEELIISNDGKSLGVVYGSVLLFLPDGKIFQPMMLRGTFGLNVRRDADKECHIGHLEAVLEPVPTFAPVNAPQIAMAHLSADIIPEAASPLPAYRAKLDGIVTLPLVRTPVTIKADKESYNGNEPITALITNNSQQALTAFDLKSYCTIVKLERKAGDLWQTIGECFLKRMALPVTLGAGETTRVILAPGDNSNPVKAPGLYRLLLDYNLGSGNSRTTETLTSVSPTIRVNDMPVRQTVSLSLDREPVMIGQAIVASIVNNSDLPIQTADHKTHCSVLHLQRLGGSGWTNVADCMLASPTRLITIGSRQSYSVKLLTEGADSLPAGTYRLELNYQTVNPNQTLGASLTVYTPQFAVREKQ